MKTNGRSISGMSHGAIEFTGKPPYIIFRVYIRQQAHQSVRLLTYIDYRLLRIIIREVKYALLAGLETVIVIS